MPQHLALIRIALFRPSKAARVDIKDDAAGDDASHVENRGSGATSLSIQPASFRPVILISA